LGPAGIIPPGMDETPSNEGISHHSLLFISPGEPAPPGSGTTVAIVVDAKKRMRKKSSVDQIKCQNKDPDRRGDRNYRDRVDMNRPPVVTVVIIDQPGG